MSVKTRKLLSMLLCIVLLIALAPSSALAADSSVELTEDDVGDIKNSSLTYDFKGENGVLTIRGNGKMPDYDWSGPAVPWHVHNDYIKEIVIEDGVENVGRLAFRDAHALDKVTIGKGVKEIGDKAFFGCPISVLKLSEGLVDIGDGSFGESGLYTELVLPSTVKTIGDEAFAGCSLEKVELPEGIIEIDDSAFCRCPLSAILLPGSIKEIGDYAFAETEFEVIEIPEGVIELGDHVFDDCPYLSVAYLPSTLKSIGEKIFSGCVALEEVHYNGTRSGWENLTANRACADAAVDLFFKTDSAAFSDVSAGDYFSDAVGWAVKHEPVITLGTSGTTFSPAQKCTRGQAVTFLWRASGEPVGSGAAHGFTDVGEDAFYYKAVLWAVENGITAGTGKTTFSPERPCTRGEIVTFLYRAMKAGETTGTMKFTDVGDGAFYYKPVLWAVENGITTGTGETTFSPERTCTRGEIVTFLYRAMA